MNSIYSHITLLDLPGRQQAFHYHYYIVVRWTGKLQAAGLNRSQTVLFFIIKLSSVHTNSSFKVGWQRLPQAMTPSGGNFHKRVYPLSISLLLAVIKVIIVEIMRLRTREQSICTCQKTDNPNFLLIGYSILCLTAVLIWSQNTSKACKQLST